MRNIILTILVSSMLAGCATNNATQVMASMSGLQAGATLGGAIGGLSSGSPRGHFMGTTIGALSGAAIGAIATAPRRERSYEREATSEYGNAGRPSKRKGVGRAPATLSGLKRDIRIVNVRFIAPSNGATLTAGETATVSYDIINVTSGTVPLLVPKMEFKRKSSHITLSPMQNIVDLPSGEGVRYSVTLTAGKKMKRGDNTLMLYLSADGGKTFTLMSELPFEAIK